jgi:hypothetical protein
MSPSNSHGAAELNNRGIPAATGTGTWQAAQHRLGACWRGSPKAKRELGATVPQPQLSYLLPPGAAGSTLVTADDDGKLSWAVRIAVAVAVFSLGILVGAAVAAWVVPPI